MTLPWLETYHACRTMGVLFPAPPIERLVVTGDDRASFLQNMCTNHVQQLVEDQQCEAFFMNVKGHVLAHAIVTRHSESFVLDLLATSATDLAAYLDRYVIREDVQLTAVSTPVILLVKKLDDLDSTQPKWLALPSSVANAEDWSEAKLESLGYQRGNDKLWNALRIEAGLSLAGIDYGDRTLPQELSRNAQAISFTKGCYLGQETVARIDALGHVNKRIVGVKFDGESLPAIGTQLFARDKQVGEISSITWSPALDAPLGLAMVRRGSDEPGTKLVSDTGEVAVVGLPLAE